MYQLLEFAQQHWLEFLFLFLSVIVAGIALLRMSRRSGAAGWIVAAAALACVSIGGLLPLGSDTILGMNAMALWITVGAVLLFIFLLAILILTGAWSSIVGSIGGVILLIGIGGLACQSLASGIVQGLNFLATVRPLHWGWLVLLLLIPVVIWLSYRSLSGLGPVRKWIAIGLRCLGIALLMLALAETHARQYSDRLTVLFLWDQSLSVPQEFDKDGKNLQEERIQTFINDAVALRGAAHNRDQVGLIVFGRWPRLELPPGNVPKLNLKRIISKLDKTYTDIGAAIKLALASFPEGTSKRMVLVSDGNQNLGDALEQARIAKHNGVQIDVVMLSAAQGRQNEVLVERVEAPPVTEKDARLPLRIVVRSHHPRPVNGKLRLTRTRLEMKKTDRGEEAIADTEKILETVVTVRNGLNTFYFQQPGSKKGESYIYEARFIPLALPGDRFENNQAEATVIARGQRAVLVIEPEIGAHQLLMDRLRGAKSSLKVVSITPERLPQNTTELALILSKFDSVILANIPSDSLTEQQQKVIRSNTHDQGCGLVMVGGPQGFGAGGWRGSEVEKALPVTCDLKTTKVEGKSGLVLIMHGTEMQQGNFWQKKIGEIAISKLSAADMVGICYYDFPAGDKWHVPFQQIGNNRAAILRRLDNMNPGDMPDARPCLKMARDALSNPAHGLASKLIIFISDGDHWIPPTNLLTDIKKRGIKCSTVCITTHGNEAKKQMAYTARKTGGRPYYVTNPKQLPAIYMKEVRTISKSFIYPKTFTPLLRPMGGPTEGLPKELEPLHAFVRTTKRASPLVSVPIRTPKIGKEKPYPVLAYWQYGLGKAVAFTSDAVEKYVDAEGKDQRAWDQEWVNSAIYTKFWEQVVEWSLRTVESGRNLNMITEYKDGKLRITIDARDVKNRPLTDVKLEAGITSPELKGGKKLSQLKFEQVNAGIYEGEIDAEEVGAYFVHVRGKWKDTDGKWKTDGVRAGVSVPYSPEFAEMTSNTSLLQEIARITGGNVYGDSADALREVANSGEVFRENATPSVSLQPIWYWLVLLAGLCLVGDVATRRISIEPAKIWAKGQEFWGRLRGIRPQAEQAPQFLDRLKTRKSRIGEDLEKTKATRRFEGGEVPAEAPPGATDIPAAPAQPKQRQPQQKPKIAAEQEEEAADFASRLMRAKKKVWEERDKDKK